MNIITITNKKGGVAKTTTALNVAASLANEKYKIGLIDLDPQANASSTFGVNPHTENNIGKVLQRKRKLGDIVIKTKFGFDLFAGSSELTDIEKELISATARETLLKKSIEKEKLADYYDILIIDTPPNLGLLTVNAFCASNNFIVPLQAQFFSYNGLAHILQFAESLKEDINPDLGLLGVVLTQYHDNMKIKVVKQIAETIRESAIGDKVFKTYIRQCTALMEAQMSQEPIFAYDPKCNGSVDYNNLTDEIIKLLYPNAKKRKARSK